MRGKKKIIILKILIKNLNEWYKILLKIIVFINIYILLRKKTEKIQILRIPDIMNIDIHSFFCLKSKPKDPNDPLKKNKTF